MGNHVIRDRLWESKKLRRCSREAALAYPWIFLVADDWGRFEYDPRRIWSKVFGSREDVSQAEVAAWLGEYEREKLLRRYQADGEEYAEWTNFHGRPPTQRRPASYPVPPKEDQSKPTDRVGGVYQDKEYRDRAEQSRNTPPTPPPGGVRDVFDHWRSVMGHDDAKLTEKRERLVRARLKHYTVEQLKAAIDGCKATPFNMGANRDGQVYDDLALICRDGEHVERYMRNARNGTGSAIALPPARAAPLGKKTRAIAESSQAFLARHGGKGAGPHDVRSGDEQTGDTPRPRRGSE